LIYQSGFTSIGIISAILLVLAVVLVIEAVRIVFFRSMPVVSK
jgi:hypothetical protein